MTTRTQRYLRPRWDFLSIDRNGNLAIEGTPIPDIVKKYGTPVYVLVERTIREKFRRFKRAFPYPKLRVQYATKCNSNLEIMRIANQEGIELDASSTGEVILGLLADFLPREITLTNLYKTEQDVVFAARLGIQAITADSLEDLELIASVGKKLRKRIPIFLRFTPIIDVGGYSTRKLQYGIPYAWYERAVDRAIKLPFIDPIGLHFHGSYISNQKVYFLAAKKMFKIAQYFLAKHNHKIKFIDLGGGFPFQHDDAEVFQVEDIGKKLSNHIIRLSKNINLPLPTLIFEPGKFFVANSGVGIVRVLSNKRVGPVRTLIVDGSTYAFLPDVLAYGQTYEILPATKMNKRRQCHYRISGCTCDCVDIIAPSVYLPSIEAGDYLTVMDCGAYSNTMASNFNSLKRAPIVMMNDDGIPRLVRRKDRFSDMFAPELDVLKVADPHELQHYYNLLRVNIERVWGVKKKKKEMEGHEECKQ